MLNEHRQAKGPYLTALSMLSLLGHSFFMSLYSKHRFSAVLFFISYVLYRKKNLTLMLYELVAA